VTVSESGAGTEAGALFSLANSSAPAGPPRSPQRRILVVEADGGSRGNPGHAGYGALVRDPDTGAVLAEKAEYLGKVSNNVAEYSGLIAGLSLADELDPDCWILARLDSKLVVEQMSGRWKIKHEGMRALASKARTIVNPRRVKYEWIPREQNKDADRLSNEAMDAGEKGVDWQPRNLPLEQPGQQPGEPAALPESATAEPAVPTGRLHHLEVWVEDFAQAESSLGWLLERVGYLRKDTWGSGASWHGADGYIVIESGTDVDRVPYSRRRPGLNHLAFRAGSRVEVDLLVRRAASHGWKLLFADQHPYAGGADHYAAYLENEAGFEVELVAIPAE
jgi:ribonuclease HI